LVVFGHDNLKSERALIQALTPTLSQREREMSFRFEINLSMKKCKSN